MRSEWQSCTLSQLFRIHRESVNPANNSNELFEHYSLPAFDATGGPRIEKGNTIESNKTLLSAPTILVSKLNPRKPRVMLVAGKSRLRRCASTEWIPYTPVLNDTDLGFYKWLFSSWDFRRRLETVATGSTNSHVRVSPSETLDWKIQHPPLPEQRRIGEILNTLDKAIRKTEQTVAKLRQMRQGLLHDLLTRGIDENGDLRDPEGHPEQFKKSELGKIPREWDVTSLGVAVRKAGGLIQTGPFGSQLHANEYVGEGVPVVMPQDILDESISLALIARISERKANELSRHRVSGNDAIFSRRGDLSRCVAIGKENIGWLCGTGCLLVRLPQSELEADWLTAFYRHDSGQRQILAKAVGSTMVNLNGKILADLLVPIPSSREQRQFIESTSAVKQDLFTAQSQLYKLRTLKQGLMDDLLTGRVRVPIRDED